VAEVLSEVVIDRKKKIYANIKELQEGRIHKEEKNQEDIRNFYLSGREQTILAITKQFSKITQELWSLYRSLRVLKTFKNISEKPNRKTQFNSDHTSSNGYIKPQTNNNRKQVEQRSSSTTINFHKNNRHKSARVDN
ncbi:26531_t:CDS:2, partial [Gigaspora margarita]